MTNPIPELPQHPAPLAPPATSSWSDYLFGTLVSPAGVTGHQLPTTAPTRLDRLVVACILESIEDDGTSNLGDWHGSELRDLAGDLLFYTKAVQASRFGQANEQKLLGGLLSYQRHFAPNRHWMLLDSDVEAATLTWQCVTADLPTVQDSITRTSRLGSATVTRRTSSDDALAASGVIRSCNLTEPKASLLHFVDEDQIFPWCAVDDPIVTRNHAFPEPSFDELPSNVIQGRWTK